MVSNVHRPIFSDEINYLVNSVNSPKLCRKFAVTGLGGVQVSLINAASKLIGKFADVMTRFWLVMILKITRNHVTTSSSRQMYCYKISEYQIWIYRNVTFTIVMVNK